MHSIDRPGSLGEVDHSRGRLLLSGCGLAVMFAVVCALHVRWIFGHFSSDGYLCDSGWFAFLFGQADPWLRNPRAVVGQACTGVNATTFLAHHLSPHIFLFGAPLAWLGRTGVDILALHQGLFFGVFAVACVAVVVPAGLRAGERAIAIAAAVLLGSLANPLLQAAAYPHYEIATFALSALAIAAWAERWRWLLLLCLLWLPLVREDGGLYVAVVCLSCLALDYRGARELRSPERFLAAAAGAGVAISAAAFAAKAYFFPGFEAFGNNFAGDGWRHVTSAFVLDRLRMTFTNWNIAPVYVGSAVLAAFDRRYLTGAILLAPLLMLHLLSVRSEHGHFNLYFALPFLLPVLLWVVLLVRRMERGAAVAAEKALVCVLVVVLSAPAQALIGTRQQRWIVAEQAVERPVADVAGMAALARGMLTSSTPPAPSGERICASMGIAALVPDDLAPQDVIDPASSIAECRTLLLLRGDMHYTALSATADAGGFRRAMVYANAEVWVNAERRD